MKRIFILTTLIINLSLYAEKQMIDAESQKLVDIYDSKEKEYASFNIKDIFYKFNIRSIHSMYGPILKGSCENYLSDFFEIGQTKIKNNFMSMEKDDIYTSISISKNKLTIFNQAIHGTYKHKSIYEVKFNKAKNEYYAIREINDNQIKKIDIFITTENKCKDYK